PDDRRHGERPGAAHLAVSGDGRPAREARVEELAQVRELLAPAPLSKHERHENTTTRKRVSFSCFRVFAFSWCEFSWPAVSWCALSWLLIAGVELAAADHTLVVLSHSNHTVYELDPSTGRILHEFAAPDQPHEGAVTADGSTIFASVPAASIVEILDGRTFK